MRSERQKRQRRISRRYIFCVTIIVQLLQVSVVLAQTNTLFAEATSVSPRFSFGDGFGEQMACIAPRRAAIASPTRNDANTGFVESGVVEIIDLFADSVQQTFTRQGPQPGDSFGASLISIPDISGNGVRDYLVGAPDQANGLGRVFLISDTGTGLGGFNSNALSGSQKFGAQVAYLGDIDWGEGTGPLSHFVISAPAFGAGSFNDGAFEIWSEGNTIAAPIFRQTVTGSNNEQLGRSLTVLNDVNKDGFNELVVGAPDRGNGGVNIYERNPDSQTYVLQKQLSGDTVDFKYGAVVQALGDIDGDSIDDLFVGAPSVFASSGSGKFLVYSGRSFFSPTSPIETLCSVVGPSEGDDDFAKSVVALEDVNQDGRRDFAVGFPGKNFNTGEIQLFSFDGTQCQLIDTLTASMPGSGEQFGRTLEYGACDTLSSGLPDILVGSGTASEDRVHILTDQTNRTNREAPLPTSANFQFRISKRGKFVVRQTFNANPAGRCSTTLVARVVAGTDRTVVRYIDTARATQTEMVEMVLAMPRVQRLDGERPVAHLMMLTQCGDAGMFRSNVFARYLTCGVGQQGVTPEQWMNLLRAGLSSNHVVRQRSFKRRKRILRKQRKARKLRREQRFAR